MLLLLLLLLKKKRNLKDVAFTFSPLSHRGVPGEVERERERRWRTERNEEVIGYSKNSDKQTTHQLDIVPLDQSRYAC